jgi:hypothetical protein
VRTACTRLVFALARFPLPRLTFARLAAFGAVGAVVGSPLPIALCHWRRVGYWRITDARTNGFE